MSARPCTVPGGPIAAIFAAVTLLVGGCVPSPTATSTTSVPVAPTGSTQASPSPTPSPTPLATLELRPPGSLGPPWHLLFEVPYGDQPNQLGTSPGGDGEGTLVGPDYGTQTADATWWFLDSAHRRLAHFSDGGAYLGELTFPSAYLHQGKYVQWQSPTALEDGSLVLLSTTIGQPALLVVVPATGTFRKVQLARFASLAITDGRSLYGFDDTGAGVRIYPATGSMRRVDAFSGLDGTPLAISVQAGALTVRHGSAAARRFPVSAAGFPGDVVHPHVEAVVAPAGTTTMLVSGLVERASGNLLFLRLASFDAAGNLTHVEDVRTTESTVDPGTGHHLGIRPSDTRPWLMFVDADGLRVYRRT